MFIDWKIAFGALLTMALFIGSITSFNIAWSTPAPTDAMSALTSFYNYRWFGFFFISTFTMGGATLHYYDKRIKQL